MEPVFVVPELVEPVLVEPVLVVGLRLARQHLVITPGFELWGEGLG